MHNVLYYHGKGLLKPIKPRPFIMQINRPHRSTQGPSALQTPRGGPCLTKKGGHGYRTFHQKAHFLEKKPFFSAVRAPPEPPALPIRRCARDFACMCVGFWPACAHFFLVRRALWLGHACTLNGQCALFLFSVRAIFYFLCARFYWAMRAIFFGPCALFFFPCARFISQIMIGYTGLCARFGCFQVLG